MDKTLIENIEMLVQDSAPFVNNQLLTTYILMSAPLNLAKFVIEHELLLNFF